MDAARLKKMTVVQLREEAKKIPDLTGVSGMKKDQLIEVVASHHGLAQEAATRGPNASKEAAAGKPVGKSEIKGQIRALKAQKQEALAANDRKTARACNRQIHHYKRLLRKMARTPAGS